MLDVLLTETKLVTVENPGLLPLRSKIRQICTESGPQHFEHNRSTQVSILMVWINDVLPSITFPTGLTITGADGPKSKKDLYTNSQVRQSSGADGYSSCCLLSVV